MTKKIELKNELSKKMKAKWDWVKSKDKGPVFITDEETQEIIDELENQQRRADGFKKLLKQEREKNA